MVLIKFPSGVDWFKANWAFRQLATDVARSYSSDNDLINALECGEALGTLDLTQMERALRSRILDAMKKVAQDVLSGNIKGWDKDEEGCRMYRDALSELIDDVNSV